MMDNFHFLRPWALALLPLAALLTFALLSLRDPREVWRGVIAPHLLEALIVRGGRERRLLPAHLLGLVWLVGILALAGPAWQRQPSPFATDSAALIVVVEVTDTMTAEDVPPSRLERASQKIGELLELRGDGDCALFAYAGSAHRAMPLTRDAAVIGYFARALTPAVMPRAGDSAAAALAAAGRELQRAGRAGSIVLISDGVAPDQLDAIDDLVSFPVHVLAMGSPPDSPAPGAAGAPPLDLASLERVARSTGGSVTLVTADDHDVRTLARAATRDIGQVSATDHQEAWKDAGYWLLFPLALMALLWSRRGWAVALPERRPAPGGGT